MKKRRMIAALVLLLTLTGCAQTAVQPDFAPAEEKRLVLSVVLSVFSVMLGLVPFYAELIKQEGLYRRFTAIREQAEGWRIAAV